MLPSKVHSEELAQLQLYLHLFLQPFTRFSTFSGSDIAKLIWEQDWIYSIRIVIIKYFSDLYTEISGLMEKLPTHNNFTTFIDMDKYGGIV